MYRKNVAGQFIYFALASATDGSAVTGATVTVRRAIDGTFAAGGGTVTEDASGLYKYAMSQADTNGNNLCFFFTASGAVGVEKTVVTTAADPTDSVRLGLTALPNAAAEAAGGLYTRGTGAGQINQDANGRIDANVKTWIGGAIPAVNVTGVPLVDVKYLLGTAWATPTVAGIPNVNVKTWNDLTTVELPLVPTTAGRKLDVSAGGEAGVDWANVGSPTTVVGLSGTTVKTATDVETDTQDIQSRLPAALVSGRIDASVGAMATGVVTATAIATDAIDADALAADAVLEIQAGLSTLDAGGVRTAVGLATANLDTQLSGINSKTTNLPASPAATSDCITAGGVRSAVGLASANLDTQLAAIDTKTTNLPSDPADESLIIAATDAIMARLGTPVGASIAADIAAVPAFDPDSAIVEGAITWTQAARGWSSALLGMASGLAGTSAHYRDTDNTKDRIVATVDSNGNRTAVTLDLS